MMMMMMMMMMSHETGSLAIKPFPCYIEISGLENWAFSSHKTTLGREQVSNVLKQNAQENIWAKVEMSKGAVKRI
jgi:hypothetical protein